jgi:hypothetical protein
VIMVKVKVRTGIAPFSPMEIDSADTTQPPNGEICIGQITFTSKLPSPAVVSLHLCTNRGGYVPIEAACCRLGSSWSSQYLHVKDALAQALAAIFQKIGKAATHELLYVNKLLGNSICPV